MAAVAGGERLAEQLIGAEAERLARARGQPAADDQGDAAAGPDFIEDDLGLERELRIFPRPFRCP